MQKILKYRNSSINNGASYKTRSVAEWMRVINQKYGAFIGKH